MSSASTYTHSVHVSGPSSALAFMRALYLKITGAVRSAWTATRLVLSASVRLPGTVATAITSMLSSDAGYSSITGAIRGAFRWIWRGVSAVARFVGPVVGGMAKHLVTLVGHVSASAADALYAVFSEVAVKVTAVASRIDRLVRGVGEMLWLLLNTTLVRTASTTVAGVAAALLVIHEATSGALANWLAQQIPGLVKAIAWVTNPWLCLAAVAVTTVGAMAIALLRLLNAGKHQTGGPETDGPDDPHDPASAADWSKWQSDLDDEALESLVAGLHISVAPDGSVTVSGIPDWVPANLRARLAKVASEAAIKQWERTVHQRPTPSRDDKRLFTKAARDAVRGYASGPTYRRRQAA